MAYLMASNSNLGMLQTIPAGSAMSRCPRCILRASTHQLLKLNLQTSAASGGRFDLLSEQPADALAHRQPVSSPAEQRQTQQHRSPAPSPLLTVGTALLFMGVVAALLHTDAAVAADVDPSQQHHAANVVFGDLASEEDFWGNVAAYARFFVTVMLGTANIVTQPFREAAKSPGKAIFIGVGAIALFAFMTVTVKFMLGMDGTDFDYLSRGV